MAQGTIPKLASPRRGPPSIDAVRNAAGSFDAEAWTVMSARDNALIEQEILHGSGSNKFIYSFKIQGTEVTGISVVGARHLAAHYGGIAHRLVASVEKTGSLFVFTSYPSDGVPMQVHTAVLPELESQDDYYSAVAEIRDVKSGNSVQIERRESRIERRRDGSTYERPHFAAIAQAKSYRNGVLSIIPQDVQIRWKEIQLSLGKNETITDSVIDEKRAAVLRFAAAKAIPLNRRSVDDLTLDQLAGLGDAAREGRVPAFVNSVRALGLDAGESEERVDPDTGEVTQTDPKSQPDKYPPKETAKPAADGEPKQQTSSDAGGQTEDADEKKTEPASSSAESETAKPAAGKKAPRADLF